jgi:FkbM family methyltransferase
MCRHFFRKSWRAVLRHTAGTILRNLPLPGRYRAYALARKLFGDEPCPFIIPVAGGGRLRVWYTPSAQEIFYLGDLDWNLRRFISKNVHGGNIAFDIGANIGLYTVELALRVGNKGKVYAFEALKANYDRLLENIELNKLQNVIPIYAAVSEKTGTLEVPAGSEGNYSLASDSSTSVVIPAVSLDDFIAEHQILNVDFIKMDIEGSEVSAFKGATKLLRSNVTIATEMNPYWLEKMGTSPGELYDFAVQQGIRVMLLNRFGRPEPLARDVCMRLVSGGKSDDFINLLMARAERS